MSGPRSWCQCPKESRVPSWAESWLPCSELHPCFGTLLVTASRRYSALPRGGKSQPHSSTGSMSHCIQFSEQMHKGIDLPDSHLGAEHLCKSLEIQDITILRRHCLPACASHSLGALGGAQLLFNLVIVCHHRAGSNVHEELLLLCSSRT